MAESAVFFLLDKLALPLLQEEVKLFSGVKEEVDYIIAEFDRMTAFLRVADSIEDSDQEIKVWVRQVRDVAHDTEDVLDVFMFRLVPRHHEGNRFLVFLGKTSRSLKNIKVRRQIAWEIQNIKSRVKDIAEGHQRYRLKYNVLLKEGSSSTAVKNTWYDPRGDALLVPEAQLVGIDKPKHDLIRLLADQSSGGLKVVSVLGMGGLGKTTLVKKVYDDAAVKKHFKSHAWLTVSESPKMEELLRDMIQQLFREINQPLPQDVERMDINRLKQVINEFLQQKRYLVVFDDVWSIHVWEAVKYAFPNKNSSYSRIMLTTRSGEIASSSCIETGGNVYPLNPLSWKESWTLFCRKAFPSNSSCPPHLKDIAQSILKRCQGLPLAIVAIGGVLATKNRSRIDEWDMLHRSLGMELQGNDKLQGIKNILSLSYNDLPWYLKICFLYLSIFPEDHEIECMRLIRLWTAEGFVQVGEAGKTIEEVAEGYIYELLNRSLIQVAEATVDGRAKTCRLHDLLREITTSKSREQNIVTIVGEQSTRWPEKVRRLSIHNNNLGNMQQKKRFYQLRSMLMFGFTDPLSKSWVSMLFSSNLRFLKVLDMRDACLETIPDEVFKMYYLTYLSLRGTKVKMLPSSIGELVNLETLDLKGTFVNVLPVEILKLQGLRHLLVYRYGSLMERLQQFHAVNGFEGLRGIGNLTSLQKLCNVEASDGGSATASELGKLTQLRRLGILKVRREDGKALFSSISKLSNLRSLSVSSIEDEILDIQSLSSTPQFLQKLYMYGRLEKLPHWILSLHNLVTVHLRWSKLMDDPLQSLQDLPNLMEIQLQRAYEGEELCFKVGGFQRLKRLYIQSLKGLRWVRVEEGAMPHLETLQILDCQLVEEVPSGIENLTELQSLGLSAVHDELLKKLNRSRGGADYWKIAHIPSVHIGLLQNGRWIIQKL